MNKGSNGQIPCSVSGHYKAKKCPDSVVMERRNEHSGSTAGTKYVSPSSLVKIVIDVVDITAKTTREINSS